MEAQVNLLRSIGRSVRIDVIIADFCMTAYCLLLIIFDSSNVAPAFLFGFTPFGVRMLYKASKFYGLCYIHKAMILHSLCVSFCCAYHAGIGFGRALYPMRWIMFLSGLVLIIVLSYNQFIQYLAWRKNLLSK